ncbi:MAG: DegT/DnrJ/EryC1/StrS family aminotransferase [Gemmatimonadota bacterium]|uniref:DegT/DnrJ/EryC1/StrS family aminotransferase n=1 Tax=Candidatus Palauibacter scopulicola TaxID=3056741 RepID=UPI0023867E2B|nr:DegT/DnrJ/EryC1/StrS family aminotransferase [Candidatus Palauibacter scopulicola]MDE2664178.1 DegT/DnrJ/EryC1/StrS family aminotransferase [Candidatus Palauibacter scopulicola]
MTGRLAIDGGTPVRTAPWPAWPRSGAAERRALTEVLESGRWGLGGGAVPELEARFAALHGARYAVACCNGTMALQAALVAAGVQPGDEVVTSPYSFVATAHAIRSLGAVPAFADVAAGTHNLDPARIEDAITERTTAILPVHIGGRPVDMDRVNEIAARRGLRVIEDAAQAWLASWRGRAVGTLGDAGAFSFQSSKNLTAGEGGMVLTSDEALYRRAWSWHDCGRDPEGSRHEHADVGLNLRMTEFQAALLLAGLERLPAEQAIRRQAMDALAKGLADIDGLRTPDPDPRITAHGCHVFMVRIDESRLGAGSSDGRDKSWMIEALRAEGIPAHHGYGKPLQPGLPVCEVLCRTTVWIKHEVLLAGAAQMQDVVDAFAKVLTPRF